VHEYHAKNLMGKYGVDHQRGYVVESADQVPEVAKNITTENLIVKAQILAGGRGKGKFNTGFEGGVKFATSVEKAQEYTSKMLGNRLITKQTAAEGAMVNKVYIAECLDIGHEYYFAILYRAADNGPVMVASNRGGVDIEEISQKHPEDIHSEPIPFDTGLGMDQALAFAAKLGFKGGYQSKAAEAMVNLYKLMSENDATQVEVNPLVETPDGRVVCVDGKINFDDNASFRRKDIWAMRDPSQEDPKEVEAEKHNLSYIALDGNIACLVNGAGLAMATMDIIQANGAKPANFLDVGGGSNQKTVTAAFKIILTDPNVKGILVNIFGGIVRCDVIAQGLIAAVEELGLKVPIVARLAGTNSAEGIALLKKYQDDTGTALVGAEDLGDAAAKIVALIK